MREKDERVERGFIFALAELAQSLDRLGAALRVRSIRAGFERQAHRGGLQLLACAARRRVQNFLEIILRLLAVSFLQVELCGEQPFGRGGVLPLQHGLHHAGGALDFAGDQSDGRFIAQIFARERLFLAQLLPEFERLRLAGERQQTRDGADRLRFDRAQLIGGDGVGTGIVPMLPLDRGEGLLGVTPGLPAFDGIARGPRRDENNRARAGARSRAGARDGGACSCGGAVPLRSTWNSRWKTSEEVFPKISEMTPIIGRVRGQKPEVRQPIRDPLISAL